MKLNFEKDANGLMQGHTNGLRYWQVGGREDCLRCRKKLEGGEMLENSYSTHLSSARFVGRIAVL